MLSWATLIVFALITGSLAFDYVVIGGGTGGLTVASRLSDDPKVTVAVIEVGDNVEDRPEIFIPNRIGTGIAATTIVNWRYNTTPQTNLKNRQLQVSAGKALGGSTIINSMINPRAQKDQYDVWGFLNNDSQWSWDGLLPFFKKSEKFTPPNEFQTKTGGVTFDSKFHGFSGRVKVGYPNFFFIQSELWRNASIKLGFKLSPDLANGEPHAVGVTSNTLDAANNTRCSAACAYYTPFASRPNFKLFLKATATKIIWSNTTKGKAVAVEYFQDGQTLRVPVEKEVILAAGTIGSPKVLELSGVGNTTILRAAGVEPYISLPTVGENFVDHVHSWCNAFTNLTLTKDQLQLNSTFNETQHELWFTNRTGVLSAAPRTLGLAAPSDIFDKATLATLVKAARKNLDSDAAQFANGNRDLAKGIAAQLKFALDLYEKDKQLPLEMNVEPGYSGPTNFTNRPKRTFTTINNVLYAPLSRGRTHIISKDFNIEAAVDPAYWSHPIDVAAHVAGIKLARKMLTTSPMDTIYQGEFEPGSDKQSDEAIAEWLRDNAASDNHETGSLSMLPRSLGGVVDTSLKVYETKNVRVVDASIIPFPVSAHIMSTIYAIGEKAAEIIKRGH